MERQRDRNRGSHASSALHIKLQSAVDIRASSCLALFASCSRPGAAYAVCTAAAESYLSHTPSK